MQISTPTSPYLPPKEHNVPSGLSGNTFHHVRHSSILPPRTFFFWGLSTILVVVFLSSVAVLLEGRIHDGLASALKKLFFLDEERNFPTLVSFAFIAISWLLVTMTGWQLRAGKSSWSRYWIALSVVLLYLSFDEAAQIHERLNGMVNFFFETSGIFQFAWVIPASIGVLSIGAIFLRFVLNLPFQIRKMVLLSAGIYVSGALGMEMIGGYIWGSGTELWIMYQAAVTVEETLELIGMMLFSVAVLKLLAQDTEATRRYFSI